MATGRLTIALAVFAAALLGLPAAAGAELPGTPCGTGGRVCGRLDVPLDRGGTLGGTISLSYSRLPAASTPTSEAVLALAGGPGQAALPLEESFESVLAPLRQGRDLLVFDQRGTGDSSPLDCSEVSGWLRTLASVTTCARGLGLGRGSYRTVDSVADIEAMRVAGGYERLVLYGVSYGTKVALSYAARHPDRVAALVLDSVVPADGPDPFARDAFAAARRVLRELCADGACRLATPNVTGDLRRAVRSLEREPLSGRVVSPSGRRIRVSLDAPELWNVLLGGDLNPALRAELPGAVRAMLRGDRTPILRLTARSDGLSGTAGARTPRPDAGGLASGDPNDTLFLTTRCEETPFPWTRTAGTTTRLREAVAAARRIPSAAFAPFGRLASLEAGLFELCAHWPAVSAAPKPVGTLPGVPTLVLSGGTDLRTSTEQARAAVASISGARVAVVANTGHSVLSSDLGECARQELEAFAAGTAPKCTQSPNIFRPTPAPPANLASVDGRTKRRRTIAAVIATLTDVRRQLIGDAIAAQRPVATGSRTGGLRGGVARVDGSTANLRAVSYVPGVTVSGQYAFRDGTSHVTVAGRSAARGSLTIDAKDNVTGTLDGLEVSVQGASAARHVSDRWPEPRRFHPGLTAP